MTITLNCSTAAANATRSRSARDHIRGRTAASSKSYAPRAAIGAALAAAAVLAAVPLALGQSTQLECRRVQSATVGDRTYFVVEVARPEGLATQRYEEPSWSWHHGEWPNLIELQAAPAWEFPIYLEAPPRADDDGDTLRLDPLVFVGSCSPREMCEAVLRYPTETRGEWREQSGMIRLKDAEPADAAELAQRLAKAQVQWFDLMNRDVPDWVGFYRFGATQLRRMHDLPAASQPSWAADLPTRPSSERLYDITTGALAIQESLQLDRMLNGPASRESPSVAIESIPAVGIKSHPFDTMRGEATPKGSPLDRFVPAENYYARFTSAAAAIAFLDWVEQWGGSLLQLARPVGADYGLRERTLHQLGLTSEVVQGLIDVDALGETVITGSDPYLFDGSDLTLVLTPRNAALLKDALDQSRTALKAQGAASINQETLAGAEVSSALMRGTDGRPWRTFWAEHEGTWLLSNSRAGLERVLKAVSGGLPRLSDAPDYQYIRAVVFPLENDSEDGLIYLSDAFVRRLVGPGLRIKQLRRAETAASLRLMTNAAMLHSYLHGPSKLTLDALTKSGCLNPESLFDPDGGALTWDEATQTAVSATQGTLRMLTPLVERTCTLATEQEASLYNEFRERYSSYWRDYFDPIALRVRMTPNLRFETCILPLIDLSAYDQFEDTCGGKPVTVNLNRFGRETLLRLVFKLSEGQMRSQALTTLGLLTGTNATNDWLGEWVTFWIEDTDAFNKMAQLAYETSQDSAGTHDEEGAWLDVFRARLVLGAQCRNKLSLAAFLVGIRTFIQSTAPNLVVFNSLADYQGVSIVQIAPDPRGEIAQELKRAGAEIPDSAPAGEGETETRPVISETGPALYYASIGDGFYISTQAAALRALIDAQAAGETSQEGALVPRPSIDANILVFAAPGAAEKLRPALAYILEQPVRETAIGNLRLVWLLGRCGLLEPRALDETAAKWLGHRIVCPAGGAYSYDAAQNQAGSTIYGLLHSPRRLSKLDPNAPIAKLVDSILSVTAHLEFTQEGLKNGVEIRRR